MEGARGNPARRVRWVYGAILWGVILVIVTLVILRPLDLLCITIHVPVSLAWLRPAPHLFVCTHDYEHVDLLAVCREAVRWYAQTGYPTKVITADKVHNRLLDACNQLARPVVRFLYVTGGTVQRALECLEHSHVCILLYPNATGTGAFHLCQGFAGPKILMRIESDATICRDHDAVACLRSTSGATFGVSYAPLETERLGLLGPTARAIMDALLNLLYSRSAEGEQRVHETRCDKGEGERSALQLAPVDAIQVGKGAVESHDDDRKGHASDVVAQVPAEAKKAAEKQ